MCQKESWEAIFATKEVHSTHSFGLYMQRLQFATPRVHHSQVPPLPGSTTTRVRHFQGPPLPGSTTPRVPHYIMYPNIHVSSIQLLFQQIIFILINSTFYLHYDFLSVSLPLTQW